MRLTRLLIILLSATLFGCNLGDTAKKDYRDSVLTNYFSLVDTSGKFDTSDINYKTLKAYYSNDTIYLKELDRYIQKQKKDRENWDLWQSDIPLPKLNQLNVETAYRFVYSIYGSPEYEVITITQKDTTHNLHYLYFYHDKENSKTEKVREFTKRIYRTDWEEIERKMLYADYWGLKNEKNSRGFDGNDLTVIGYKKYEYAELNHYVHRWTRTTLNDPFYHIYYGLLNKNERLYGTK